ncbi:hypothetical protein D9756_002341 [Leucocoprinus leucothites]|uniref:Cryptic loci regulator 2 N-terminal domain-containing protein n=1 Tax=Leucocoprinus leucothites TaxID=201217 RepID=A0A8H5LLX8_9AGAR|nr:hypothetical protein D9756_002341 [Leucoagaricus leucothites]
MSRRVAQPSVTFGPSTVFLQFPRSDGNEARWPTNTTRIVDSEGQVNFMELLDAEESGQARKWRAGVGKAIAAKLEMQGDSNNYVLQSWPAGYQMYDHHKGPAGNPRHDIYLYGYRSGRFRSINEFIPHAIWLFSDATMNYANCECKYCTKQPQKGITASMGDILGTPLSASPVSRVRREKAREKNKSSRPYASVQKILKPALKPSPHIQDTPILAERNSDLRAVFSRNSMKLKRWYRDGEVVWCQLSTPIPGPSGDSSTIVFWPGLVQECKLKAVPIPRENLPTGSTSNPPNPSPGPSSTSSNAHEEGRGTVYEKTERLPFTVEQSTIYTVELFGVSKSIRAHDHEVIPYQAHVPSDELILAMQEIKPERLNFDRDVVSAFNPRSDLEPPSFEDAAGPYAIALQIASNVSQFFSVTDEYEFTYSVPPPPPAPSTSQNQPDNSLIAVINAAGRINAASLTSVNSHTPHLYRNISGTQPSMSPSAVDKLADDLLGSGPRPMGTTRTQIRFQGLWWGPERIWVDEFVRLKVPRRCLAPHGSQDISPPAGPSKQAVENYKVTGRDISEIGAGSRGVFMRIDALFVVEIMSEGRKRKECRASGPLFELVDEDWDENEDVNVKQHKLRTQATTETGRPTNPLPTRTLSSSATQPRSAPLPTPSSSAPSIPQSQPTPATSSLTPNKMTTPAALPTPYLPPQPPLGYRFRPILTPGYEAVVSLSLLAGRYYPGLLMHPLLVAEMSRAARVPLEEGGILKYGHIWALDGLNGGFHCAVDPDKFQSSRQKMLDRVDKEAYVLLDAFKRNALAKNEVEEEEEEDVDMLAKDEDGTSEDERNRGFTGNGLDRDGDVTMH